MLLMLLTAPYILLKTTLTRDITHTEIEINQGDTFSVLLNKLGISNDIEQKLLIMWAKYNNLTKSIKPGIYRINSTDNVESIMYNIANGLSVMHSFTIVEGQNIFDITDQLAAMRLLYWMKI